jgi:hypothetical protein
MASTINAKTTGVGGIDASGDASGVLALQTGGTTALTIDASQNVGIGTSSPNKQLQIQYGSTNSGQLQITNNSTGTTATDGVLFGYDTSNDVIINNQEATATKLYTSGTERMRIDSSGNVGINTTVTSNGLLNLVVDGRALFLAAKTQSAGAEGGEMAWARGTDGTAFWTMDVLAGAAPTIRIINNSGAGVSLASGATAWGAYSDIRLKTNVMPLRAVLSDIAGIECINYHLKDIDTDEDRIRIGVSAQSLVGKFDEVIDVTQKKKDPTDYLSVRYSDMIPYLVKAIQELKAIIDTQNARIEALEAK